MIQEKYNRRIFDEGTIEGIENLSHLRSNVLSPVGITKGDNVLMKIWGYKNLYILHNVDWFGYSGEQFGTTPLAP